MEPRLGFSGPHDLHLDRFSRFRTAQGRESLKRD